MLGGLLGLGMDANQVFGTRRYFLTTNFPCKVWDSQEKNKRRAGKDRELGRRYGVPKMTQFAGSDGMYELIMMNVRRPETLTLCTEVSRQEVSSRAGNLTSTHQ